MSKNSPPSLSFVMLINKLSLRHQQHNTERVVLTGTKCTTVKLLGLWYWSQTGYSTKVHIGKAIVHSGLQWSLSPFHSSLMRMGQLEPLADKGLQLAARHVREATDQKQEYVGRCLAVMDLVSAITCYNRLSKMGTICKEEEA
jgi:hypothetical protein